MSAPAQFSTGLFDCLNDLPLCIFTCFCPYCSNSVNWSMIRGDECNLEYFLCPTAPYWTRQFIRSRKHMEKARFSDAVEMVCCTECFICQDGRELKNGFGVPPPSEHYWSRNSEFQQELIKSDAPQGYASP